MHFSNFLNFRPLNNSLELWIIFSWTSLPKGIFWQNKKKLYFSWVSFDSRYSQKMAHKFLGWRNKDPFFYRMFFIKNTSHCFLLLLWEWFGNRTWPHFFETIRPLLFLITQSSVLYNVQHFELDKQQISQTHLVQVQCTIWPNKVYVVNFVQT